MDCIGPFQGLWRSIIVWIWRKIAFRIYSDKIPCKNIRLKNNSMYMYFLPMFSLKMSSCKRRLVSLGLLCRSALAFENGTCFNFNLKWSPVCCIKQQDLYQSRAWFNSSTLNCPWGYVGWTFEPSKICQCHLVTCTHALITIYLIPRNLAYNQIPRILKTHLKDCPLTTALRLRGNEIAYIEDGALAHLTSLQQLWVTDQ